MSTEGRRTRSVSRRRAIVRRRRIASVIGLFGVLAILRGTYVGSDSLLLGARWVATATVPEIAVYTERGDPKPSHRLPNPDPNGSALVFLVEGDDASGEWLPVYLPVRPNGTKAWIRTRHIALSQTRYRIAVDLSAHNLTVTHNGREVIETKVGIGRRDTPTPSGDYFIKELIKPPTRGTLYGPYVFGLSGFSNSFTSSDDKGGGVIGIHGTNNESSIGRNVSRGCIRAPNNVISTMATIIPLGTPVEILP